MDSDRTSIQPGPGPLTAPKIAWTHDLGNAAVLFPILVDGLVIDGTQDGHLVALDALTGDERWRASVEGTMNGALSATDSTVITTSDAAVEAFDVATGTKLWTKPMSTDNQRPEILDGVVYVGTTDGAIYGLDVQSGDVRWSWQGDHSLSERVDVVSGGIVYATPSDGSLHALSLADGSERWKVESPTSRVNVTIGGGTVYLSQRVDEGASNGQVAAINPADGSVRWRFVPPSGQMTVAGPWRDGILYVGSAGDGVYALADNGDSYQVLWHTPTDAISWPVALVGDLLYGSTIDGSLIALDSHTGAIEWQVPVAGSGDGPIVSGGMVFEGTQGGDSTVSALADDDVLSLLPAGETASGSASPSQSSSPFTIVGTTPASDGGVQPSIANGPPEGVSMAVSPDDLLYVSDHTDTISVVDPKTGKQVRAFGGHGSADGQFDQINAMAVAKDGQLYVLDRGNHRVQVLDSSGNYLRQVGAFGTGEGQFVAPFRLAVDDAGSVYVLDGDTSRVSKFDANGAFVWRAGGIGGSPPLGITHDVAVMPDGNILVTIDAGGPAALLNPNDGSLISRWGDSSIGASGELSVDPRGNVALFQYVPEAMRLFDATGQPLGRLDYPDPNDATDFYPAPTFTSDGFGYSYDAAGDLVKLQVTLP
jgi:outer membrane protein assembly factor BamB